MRPLTSIERLRAAELLIAVALGATASAQSTTRASLATGGFQANSENYVSAMSPDGNWLVFASDATNLVPGDTNGFRDVFLHHRSSGTTERVSVSSGPAVSEGNNDSCPNTLDPPSLTPD